MQYSFQTAREPDGRVAFCMIEARLPAAGSGVIPEPTVQSGCEKSFLCV